MASRTCRPQVLRTSFRVSGAGPSLPSETRAGPPHTPAGQGKPGAARASPFKRGRL